MYSMLQYLRVTYLNHNLLIQLCDFLGIKKELVENCAYLLICETILMLLNVRRLSFLFFLWKTGTSIFSVVLFGLLDRSLQLTFSLGIPLVNTVIFFLTCVQIEHILFLLKNLGCPVPIALDRFVLNVMKWTENKLDGFFKNTETHWRHHKYKEEEEEEDDDIYPKR